MNNPIRLSNALVFLFFAMTVAPAQRLNVPSQSVASTGPSRGSQQTCPTISVSCPGNINEGKPVSFNAIVTGDPNGKATYDWSVDGGTITQGQGTPAIKVIKSVGHQGLTATVRIGGFDRDCPTTASCSLIVDKPPPVTKIESYRTLTIKKENERLQKFAALLRQQPGAQGYILSYGGRRSSAGDARVFGNRARDYLVRDEGIDPGRIVMVDGGFKEQPVVELWLVPTGSNPPAAAPTVDPSEIKSTKPTPKKPAKRRKA